MLFRSMIMTIVINFGLVLLSLVLETIFDYKKVFESHDENFAGSLIIGGCIISSLAFRELSNPLKRTNYLTLPATSFEKFLSMWLLTCVGWIVLFTILYVLNTLLANEIGHILFKQMVFRPFNPFSSTSILAMQYYFVLQGIFLAAAVHFKGYVFPRTIFVMILFALFSAAIAYFFMAEIIHSDFECTAENNPLVNMPIYSFWTAAVWMFWWILAPVSWVVTYFGLKEQEV